MRKQIDSHSYRSLDEFEDDFNLIISNCMTYNAKETFFYKAAQRMLDHGGVILRRARREVERIGFDFPSCLQLPEAPKLEPPPPFSWEEVDRLLTPSYRQQTPLEDQLKELLEKLDLSTAMKHSPSRTKRLKLLKKTIMEVRSEISLKKSLPHPPPSVPDLPPSPSQSEEKPSPEGPADSLPPPTLERLTTSSQHEISPNSSVPPSPKPATPVSELTPMQLDDNTSSSTSKPPYTPNEHLPDQLLPNSDFHTELTGNCNQRTNTLFRKSKSASPQKAPMTQEPAVSPPPLGAKTFLSVVIPRLETLLLPKKRTRSSSAEDEEEEETPIKRLGTGSDSKQHNHAVGKKMTSNLISFSTLMVSKSVKGRPAAARRSTVDDRSTLMTCVENGKFTKTAPISSDRESQSSEDIVSAQEGGASHTAIGRSQSRRADAIQVRRETLPRPLLRQQAQLVRSLPDLLLVKVLSGHS
ncbi:hypothetical protein GOODEAATRI_011784 [Goodea atripinnis]|uniref:Bromo domain-containing protein n=1 Tax=Goodea atripinnis TaxID=208336 RepID=A0ABV0N2Q5_9TELE